MKIEECFKNISTFIDLKRITNAYVIDNKQLTQEELIKALLKTAPQYSNFENLRNAWQSIILNDKRDIRVLAPIFVLNILLNKDDFQESQKIVDEEIIKYEQQIINESNEHQEKNSNEREKLFRFILESAWGNDDNISVDEKNLIEKVRTKFGITQREYRIFEAQIKKFPQNNNLVHTKSQINEIRKYLQSNGIICSIRDSHNIDYDILPIEIAENLRKMFNIEIKESGYQQLINYKYVRNKSYLAECLNKSNIDYDVNGTLTYLQNLVIERVNPSNLLGGYTLTDGLDKGTLFEWCKKLEINVSGTKSELVQRITKYYDNFKQIETETKDSRELLFEVYEALADRNMQFLRKQNILSKDLECERNFEIATNYLFEKLLRHKPLLLKGSDHPDGILSFNDKLIMWDNKSKERQVKLLDHIKQFDRYIRNSEKQVAVFMVIAPDFSLDSTKECAKYALTNDTQILLITAKELKNLALRWQQKHKNDEISFPLGYFKQNGRFEDKDIII
ncbi:MAG: hypothetical protein PHR96_01495 [Clostridia bacterium]|nr:hypothetical protein [Clostridia bacterium]